MENKFLFVSRVRPHSTPWDMPWKPGCPPRKPGPWDPPYGMPPCVPPDPVSPLSPIGPCVPPPLTSLFNYQQEAVEQHPLYRRIEEALTAARKPRVGSGPKRTHIFFLLDQSLSMAEHKAVTISGYNDQTDVVREQHLEGGKTSISLVLFNSQVTTRYAFAPVDRLEKLTDESYKPRTWTALYDGIGQVMELIIQAEGFDDPDTAFFVVIFTDGKENASQRCTGSLISRCMSKLEATGRVTFSFMGPTEELRSIADVLKFAPGNMAGFDASSGFGRTQAFSSMAGATRHYMRARSFGATSVSNLFTPDGGDASGQ